MDIGYIYVLVRECGEIECAFTKEEEANEYKHELERMSDGNIAWNIIKVYCY